MTHSLVLDVLGIDWWRTDAVLAHARQFFPDLTIESVPAPGGPPTPVPAGATVGGQFTADRITLRAMGPGVP